MVKSSLCNYSDAYIIVKGTIVVVKKGTDIAGTATIKALSK